MPKASELVIEYLERAPHHVHAEYELHVILSLIFTTFLNVRPSVQDWNLVFQGPDAFRDLLVVNFATSG